MKISLSTLLFLIFLVLKLTNKITWSWWLVMAPLWGSFALWAVVIGISLAFIAHYDNDN